MSLSIQKIHDVVRFLEHEGRSLDSVESFLINDLDLRELLSSMDEFSGIYVPGQIKICGIKIIESHYVPRGSIFKVFKDAEKRPHTLEMPWMYSDYNGYSNAWTTTGTEMTPKFAVKQKQSVGKKHSQTRKIELGE